MPSDTIFLRSGRVRSTSGSCPRTHAPHEHRRRAAVAPYVVVLMPVIMGFGALTIDMGRMENVRVELQNVSDAAALAGASVFVDVDEADLIDTALARAQAVALRIPTLGTGGTQLASEDVVVGYLDYTDPAAVIDPAADASTFNAVQVAARRGGAGNSSVPMVFAWIVGKTSANVSATGTAAFDDRFVGFRPTDGALLPLVMSLEQYEDELVTGPDDFSYDPELDAVLPLPDGTPELHLFPAGNGNGGGNDDGAGNFGLLNFGIDNEGANGVADQILNGVTQEHFLDEPGVATSQMLFRDGDGNSLSYEITGNPGISASLEDEFETRVGTLIGFFLYSTVDDGGSNAIYTIVGLRFGRLMEVVLTGNNKRVVVQPEAYTGTGVLVDSNAPSTDGMVGVMALVR